MESQNAVRRTTTVESAAVQLGISRWTAYELARQGKLPGAIRLGRRFVVSQQIIDQVLSGERNVGTADDIT